MSTILCQPGHLATMYPVELHEKLLQWVLEKCDLQFAVTVEMLKLHAQLIITPVQSDFEVSVGGHSSVNILLFEHPWPIRYLEEKITAFHKKLYYLRMTTDIALQ